MYPISQAVAALFEAEQRQILRITGTDKNGETISITGADVMMNSFNIDRYSCNGEKLEVGTAIAAGLEFKLYNGDGRFDDIIFEGAELFVEIGIADWTQETPVISYIPCGYFTPDEQPRKRDTISIQAMDRMARFDVAQPFQIAWTDNNGNFITDNNGNIIYFGVTLSFPCTVGQLVTQACTLCNVPFSQDLSSLPNYNYTITALPTLQQEITMRHVIQWCAGMMGTCAFIDWTGSLVFKWYSAVSYTSTLANRYNSDLYENAITVTGVQYTNSQNITIVSGTSDYALDMTGNYLAETGIAEILPNVNNVLNGFSYKPFNASVIAAPWLWPLDVITFTDKDNVNHTCAVTNVGFGLNGSTQLAGKGMTAKLNSQNIGSGVTQQEANLIESAAEVARKLDEELDQEGIFNRLTNDGEIQGLLLYNGKVYLNASYINTGTLNANFIKGGTLTLGGSNNTNGVFEVLDAQGDVIGRWDNTGIILNKGTISGPSITLGGANNANGVLSVKNSNGQTVGVFDNTGINIGDGAFSVDIGGALMANDASLNGSLVTIGDLIDPSTTYHTKTEVDYGGIDIYVNNSKLSTIGPSVIYSGDDYQFGYYDTRMQATTGCITIANNGGTCGIRLYQSGDIYIWGNIHYTRPDYF